MDNSTEDKAKLAAKIVSGWPLWKRAFLITKYSYNYLNQEEKDYADGNSLTKGK